MPDTSYVEAELKVLQDLVCFLIRFKDREKELAYIMDDLNWGTEDQPIEHEDIECEMEYVFDCMDMIWDQLRLLTGSVEPNSVN
jgi:hypothetical protein